MFDPQRVLGQLVSQALGLRQTGAGRRALGLGAGGLGDRAALGLGVLGIALAAYEHYRQPNAGNSSVSGPASKTSAAVSKIAPPPPPVASPGTPPPPPAADAESAADARLLVQCMIAAAAADGSIDPEERARILSRMQDLGLDADDQAFLSAELAAPKSADEIGANTRPGLVEAAYAAAWLGIDPDLPAETAFLDRLAGALGLTAAERQHLVDRLSGINR